MGLASRVGTFERNKADDWSVLGIGLIHPALRITVYSRNALNPLIPSYQLSELLIPHACGDASSLFFEESRFLGPRGSKNLNRFVYA